MSNDNEQAESFTIEEILTDDNYIIPIYQRNYAWGKDEIVQLIQDVWDSWRTKKDKNYYIGTLVTHKRDDGKYEVLDGQQRLTTLYILVGALKRIGGVENETLKSITSEKLNLHFEAREKSTQTLKNILENKIKEEQQSIINGFKYAKDYFLGEKKNEIQLDKFITYLLKNVILVRTIVPPDTDLNHYFEIMNNRGEQLEKHEILKAQLLECIKDGSSSKYAKVWEACSQMNSYVQMNFDYFKEKDGNISDRDKLFEKDWNTLNIDNIKCIQKVGDNEKVNKSDNEKCNKNTIDCILKKGISGNDGSGTGGEQSTSEKFESIIDFPNFLLQVLKVQYDENVSLDDKKLLEEFRKSKTDGKFTEKFAKKFIKNLLAYRFCFDKYIIKRNLADEKNNWGLQKLEKKKKKKNEKNQSYNYINSFENKTENKNIIMIQSMFHVSNSSKSNKRWLQEVFVENKEKIAEGKIDYRTFLIKLEQISRDLLFERIGEVDLGSLSYNENRPTNYIFNLLDYVIWKNKNENKNEEILKNLDTSKFSFKFRNSIEHFYPQNPITGEKLGDDKALHSFGNLALTTRSLNSKLSNLLPQGKLEHLRAKEEESLKFQLMAEKAGIWNNKTTINEHQEAMQKLLDGYLQKT